MLDDGMGVRCRSWNDGFQQTEIIAGSQEVHNAPDPEESQMTEAVLCERLLLQLQLALASNRSGPACIQAARSSGLSLAEIDAALAGTSFDVQAAAAIDLALSLRAGNAENTERARQRGERLGLSGDALGAIVFLTEQGR